MSPAIPARRYRCTGCELPTERPHCPCGNPVLPLIDRRPVLLDPAVRRHVREALRRALAEWRTAPPARARLLHRWVVPHLRAVLREHDEAELRDRRSGRGFRLLFGTVESQIRRAMRVPALNAALRSSRAEHDDGAKHDR